MLVSVDLKQLQGTPIPTDVDLKQPVVVYEGDHGGMLLPEAKLTSEAFAKAGDKIVPIGQLWLRKMTPQELPLDFTAERTRDTGCLTIKILGKYEAKLMVTELELQSLGYLQVSLFRPALRYRQLDSRSQPAERETPDACAGGGGAAVVSFWKDTHPNG